MFKPLRVSARKVTIALSFVVFLFLISSIKAQTPTPTPQFAPAPQTSPAPKTAPVGKPEDPLELFQYRQIGPFRGGRVTAVAGIPFQPNVYYFGATGGGVWKTIDGGVNWAPVSDEFFKTGSVGAIGVSQSDPNILYVGMGE